MVSVIVLGFGNLGFHIVNQLSNSKTHQVIQVYSQSKKQLGLGGTSIPVVSDISNILPANIYILTLPDDVITHFSSKLNVENSLIIHTSGSQPLSVLEKHVNKGVLYPLQSFTKGQEINFSDVPLFIEASTKESKNHLECLALQLSTDVHYLTSKKRIHLHLAAVFINNFTNHLCQIASDICEKESISFKLLLPLLNETFSKLNLISPQEAQTGPAKRNDLSTINQHLSLLKNDSHKEIYKLLTQSIKNTTQE